MRKSNLYKVEYTDFNGARVTGRYVTELVDQVSKKITRIGSDVVITPLGRVNIIE
jgi:hypothetical protein